MNEEMKSRRRFLTQMGMGGAAMLVMDRLLSAQGEFQSELGDMQDSFSTLRKQYSLDKKFSYLNHASIGTMPRLVQDARQKYLAICESNPWLYMWGGEWDPLREETRSKAAKLLGCESDEVLINHNTTEGMNLLASGLAIGKGDEVLFSSFNHAGASVCWQHFAKERGYQVRRFDLPKQLVSRMSKKELLDRYAAEISDKTTVLVFPHVDNMLGLRHPVKELTALAREKGVRFVACDGAQVPGMLPVDMRSSGLDFYCTSPHKWLQAPKGLGLMFIAKSAQESLRAAWVTWGQKRWKGSVRVFEDYGTRNLAEVLSLGDAIDFQQKLGATRKEKQLKSLWQRAKDRVSKSPRLLWRSPEKWEMGASLFAVEVKGVKSNKVFETLWAKHGYVFRAFAGKDLNTLRISPNVMNTSAELDRLFALIEKEFPA